MVRREQGLTYLGVLLAVAILGTSLAATGTVWHTARRQDNEKELLFVGDQYRRAIEAYYLHSPGAAGQYPPTLEALLQDPRQATVTRYLRRLYRDPITGSTEWGLVRGPGGGIAGVFSLSEERPLKQANFGARYESFANAGKYSDWRFVFMGGTASALPPPAAPGVPGVTLVPPPAPQTASPDSEPAPQVPPITE